MTTRVADYRDAVEHLPEGAALVIRDVTWEEYERVLEDLAERHVRVTYDRGTLEIMTPLSKHEKFARFIDALVQAWADAGGLIVEHVGSTTWKRRRLARGTEPDACYYVAAAARIIGKLDIDLESDPPPDVVLEIDITNESLSKFSIYAALGVPEIWRDDGKAAQFYALAGDTYEIEAQSRFLIGLTPAMLTEALEESKTAGQTAALESFRKRIRNLS
jgi:Uma2 family endonuclease